MKPLHRIAIVLLAFGLFVSTQAISAQDGVIDQKANELVRAYQADLGLTIEQAADFHKAIKHYLGKRMEINAMDASSNDKVSMMKDVDVMENKAMQAILDAKQLKAYKKLKKELQPV